MACCGLTGYGRRELAVATIAFVLLCAGIALLARWAGAYWLALLALPGLVYGWVLWFFRDPERSPQAERALISPADGVVCDITQIGPDSPLGREGTKIGIFMSVFSVHVNRSPFAARVESVVHQPGAFLDARDVLASERNEAATIRLTVRAAGGELPVVVRQVAGLVARRIVTDLRAGQTLETGQRIGMIKFGSRLELLVPRELVGRLAAALGQSVRAGQTPLVELPPEGAGSRT